MSRSSFIHRRNLQWTLISADSFNRANNSSTIGTTDGAGIKDPLGWTNQIGTWGISSNAATQITGTARVTVSTGFSDVWIRTKLVTGANLSDGILFRFSDTSNWWSYTEISGTMTLSKVVAGTNTNFTPIVALTPAPGYIHEVFADGPNIATYTNGTLTNSVNDSFNQSATLHGYRQQAGLGTLHSAFDDLMIFEA